MKTINLKSLKYSASLSEETLAFTATVYVDGKRVGDCVSRGHGGPIDFHIGHELELELIKQFQDDDTTDDSFESHVFGLVCDELEARDMKRWTKKAVLFRLEGDEEGVFRTVKFKVETQRVKAHKFIVDKYGDKIIETHGGV